jgi:DNA modification methylase
MGSASSGNKRDKLIRDALMSQTSNFPPYKIAKVADLIPYARNARTHSDEQVAQIAASIREFGFTNPVITDGKNGIIAGHGRVLAARKLGLSDVPTVELSALTEAQKRAYIIADNKLALNAGWDFQMLGVEFEEIQALNFDLGLTGFSPEEIGKVLAKTNTGLTDPDDAPSAQEKVVTELGEVWLLGKHRIVCGDSTKADDVAKALNGVSPHLMVTDPPYGVEYDPTRTSNNAAKAGRVLNDDRADWREAWALFPGDVAYIWHADLRAREVVESLEVCGFSMRAQIIWSKDRMTLGRGHYHFQHEPCWYAVKKGGTGHWGGGRDKTTIWNIKAREDGGHGHGTQKPVECMKRPIENNSSPGQAVYEPFSGSGTTIIAAEMTGRSCHAIELNPAYVDIAVRRWEAFTGLDATLEGTDKTFKTVEQERLR